MANELSGVSVDGPAAPAAQPAAPELPSPFADVAQGTVPAVSLAPIEGQKMDPAQQFVLDQFDALPAAGLDYHDIPETHISVIFNPGKVTIDDIEAAYKAGTLDQLAPQVRDLKPVGAAPAAPGNELAAPAPAQGALSGASAVANPGLGAARARNLAPAPKNAPNPVPGQLAKRAI